jgi:hypothetical protein
MCLTCGCGDAHKRMTASADRSDHQQEYDQPWETGKR